MCIDFEFRVHWVHWVHCTKKSPCPKTWGVIQIEAVPSCLRHDSLHSLEASGACQRPR